jgi:hypothetical protein
LTILNVNYKSTINLFGAHIEGVSIIVIVVVGFVVGIIYSFVIHVLDAIRKQGKTRNKKRQERLTQKVGQLKVREESAAAEKPPDTTKDSSGRWSTGRFLHVR